MNPYICHVSGRGWAHKIFAGMVFWGGAAEKRVRLLPKV